MSTKQCFTNGNLVSISANSTNYNNLMGSGAFNNPPSGTETDRIEIAPNAGVIRNMRFQLDTAVTAGSITLTLRVNGADTALTKTITTGTTGDDLVHEVTVAADDELSWKIVSASGTNSVRMIGYSCEYESDNDNESESLEDYIEKAHPSDATNRRERI